MIVMNGMNKAIHNNKQHKYFPSEKVDFQINFLLRKCFTVACLQNASDLITMSQEAYLCNLFLYKTWCYGACENCIVFHECDEARL